MLTKRQHIWGLGFVMAISIFTYLLLPYCSKTIRLANGYAAKYVCSHIFLANFPQDVAISGLTVFPTSKVKLKINEEEKTVTSSLWGFGKRKAYFYKKGKLCGCSLDKKVDLDRLPMILENDRNDTLPWPRGSMMSDDFNLSEGFKNIQGIIDHALHNNDQIRAVVVSNGHGELVESYAEYIKPETPLLGWSMTKSIHPLLYGVYEKNQRVKLEDHPKIKEWQEDQRKNITYRDLLQMNSGLEWDEDYTTISPATTMLFFSNDMVKFVKGKGMEAEAGQHWEYSGGTSNLLSGLLHDISTIDEEYYRLPFDSVFDILGMESARIEMDLSGHFVMSSFGWATARDWTRFGMLFLKKGNWFGHEVFDSDWYDFIVKKAPNSEGGYGCQIWLNSSKTYTHVPEDAYFADGYGGQRVLIIPSKDIVITILAGHAPDFDLDQFFGEILTQL